MTRVNALSPTRFATASQMTEGDLFIDENDDLFVCVCAVTARCWIDNRQNAFPRIPVVLNRSGRPHVASLRSAARRADRNVSR